MKSFNNKVAAVTGAGSGIGQQLAILLAKAGCHLALSDINQEGLEKTKQMCDSSGVTVIIDKLDVADKDAMRAWAAKVVADHGRVNMIFNNAGVALSSTVAGMTYEELEWLMNINFWGVVYGTKEFLPYLKESGDGHVINISSLFGLTSQPSQSAYNASKFAVRGFTESLRQELDIENCGVSALSVHPGGIKTNIAVNARINPSMDNPKAIESFNKLLRKPPVEAAQDILDAVKANSRRVLIGNDAKVFDLLQRALPQGYQVVTSFMIKHIDKLQR